MKKDFTELTDAEIAEVLSKGINEGNNSLRKEVYDAIIRIRSANYSQKVYGVPRGGSIIAGLTLQAVDNVRSCDIIIDDILDSGQTYKNYKAMYPGKPFIVAFNRNEKRFKGYDWIVFPWEGKEIETDYLIQIQRLALELGANKEEAIKRFDELYKEMKNK